MQNPGRAARLWRNIPILFTVLAGALLISEVRAEARTSNGDTDPPYYWTPHATPTPQLTPPHESSRTPTPWPTAVTTQTPTRTPNPTNAFTPPPSPTLLGDPTPTGPDFLTTNPWFSDQFCQPTKNGWTDTGALPMGLSKKDSNPGPCGTALRWHANSHPAGVWGSVEQLVLTPGHGYDAIDMRYLYVSLGTGQGEINLYGRQSLGDPWVRFAQQTWDGHLIMWQQSDWILYPIPAGFEYVKIELRGMHAGANGGVKATAIELVGR